MNYLSQYTIPFSGLKEGEHLFDFIADDRFFAGFEESEITKGSVAVQVKLEKRSTYLRLSFALKGEVELICDRCLADSIMIWKVGVIGAITMMENIIFSTKLCMATRPLHHTKILL